MTQYKNAVWNIRKAPDEKVMSKNIQVEINGVMSHIPSDENNSDYIEILKQVADGTITIKDAE
tara:strand:- start:33 stop:221 length:189 start_codon:yes stop_codon:yes gene_type:complete